MNPKQLSIPNELPQILKNYTKQVLRQYPNDLISFSKQYFQSLYLSQSLPSIDEDYYLLTPLQQIKKKLFKSVIYVFVTSNNKIINKTSWIQFSKDIEWHNMKSIKQVTQIVQQRKNNNFKIITNQQFATQVVSNFKAIPNVIQIYINSNPQKQKPKLKSFKIKLIDNDENNIIEKLKINSKSSPNDFVILPNFSKITDNQNSQDNIEINHLRYNIYSILNFKNNKQAKADFIKLATFNFQQRSDEIENFNDEYPLTVEENGKKIIQWYTKETFFYKLVNNFLRICNSPLEIPYIRLPIKLTFNYIKSTYQSRIKSYQKQFKLYRKGFIESHELQYLQKNVGEYIQMYGFMSTTKNLDVLNNFLGNIIFIIIVQHEQRQIDSDYGFLEITQENSNFDQEQVLFNILNVFKILSFERQQDFCKVTLKYGQLSRIIKRSKQQILSQKQQGLVINYQHQISIINKFILNKSQGHLLFQQGLMQQAQIYMNNEMIILKNDENTLEKAKRIQQLGLIYFYKGNRNKAKQLFSKSLEILNNVANGKDMISIVNNIGMLYKVESDYQNALNFFKTSLDIIKNNNLDFEKQVITRINIADIYKNKNQLKTSELQFQKINQIIKKQNAQHKSIHAQVLNNIALFYHFKADYKKALQLANQAEIIYKNTIGQTHKITASVFNTIGICYLSMANYQLAIKYIQKVISICKKYPSQNKNLQGLAYYNLGIIYTSKNEKQKALFYYEQALRIKMIQFGQYNASVAQTLYSIGVVYSYKNEFDKSLPYYQKSLKIAKSVLGENNTTVANTLIGIGVVFLNKNQIKKGIQYQQKALKIYQKIFGENNPSIAMIINNIGSAFEQLKDYNKCLEYYEKTQKIYLKSIGQFHDYTSRVLHNIAKVYQKLKKYDKACMYQKRAYQINKKIFGQKHQLTSQSLKFLTNVQKLRDQINKI